MNHFRGTKGARAWLTVALMALFAVVALVRPFGRTRTSLESPAGRVASVIDGDTVRLADGRHVRYIGIDSPEMDSTREGTRSLAQRARDLNVRLVDGKDVTLEFDVQKKDRYGRTLAYVWVGDMMVNAELVRQGLARARFYGDNRKHSAEFDALEATARAEGKGIWAPAGDR